MERNSMFRKNLIIIGSFLTLSFTRVAYAGSCPGSNNCPIDTTVLTYLKARGVPQSEIVQANQFLERYVAKLSKSH